MKELGRDLDQILHQYSGYVKPAFEEFCLPVSISWQFSKFVCRPIIINSPLTAKHGYSHFIPFY